MSLGRLPPSPILSEDVSVRPNQVSLGVLVTAVRRDAVDAAVTSVRGGAKRSDAQAPAHVTAYLTMALCLFADDEYTEVVTKVTGSLSAWRCWDAGWSTPTPTPAAGSPRPVNGWARRCVAHRPGIGLEPGRPRRASPADPPAFRGGWRRTGGAPRRCLRRTHRSLVLVLGLPAPAHRCAGRAVATAEGGCRAQALA
jgi:Insertion element 4 transposase N-terminal